jgi:hypothetical protein
VFVVPVMEDESVDLTAEGGEEVLRVNGAVVPTVTTLAPEKAAQRFVWALEDGLETLAEGLEALDEGLEDLIRSIPKDLVQRIPVRVGEITRVARRFLAPALRSNLFEKALERLLDLIRTQRLAGCAGLPLPLRLLARRGVGRLLDGLVVTLLVVAVIVGVIPATSGRAALAVDTPDRLFEIAGATRAASAQAALASGVLAGRLRWLVVVVAVAAVGAAARSRTAAAARSTGAAGAGRPAWRGVPAASGAGTRLAAAGTRCVRFAG